MRERVKDTEVCEVTRACTGRRRGVPETREREREGTRTRSERGSKDTPRERKARGDFVVDQSPRTDRGGPFLERNRDVERQWNGTK